MRSSSGICSERVLNRRRNNVPTAGCISNCSRKQPELSLPHRNHSVTIRVSAEGTRGHDNPMAHDKQQVAKAGLATSGHPAIGNLGVPIAHGPDVLG